MKSLFELFRSNSTTGKELKKNDYVFSEPKALDNMNKEGIGGLEDFDEILSSNYMRPSNVNWIFVLIYGSALFSWLIGFVGLSFAWIIILVSTALVISSSSISRILQDAKKEEIVKVRRKKALAGDETAEWLNFMFNRWWTYSSTTAFQLLRDLFEPLLNEVKPSFVESVEFRQFTFGDQTPCIKSIKAYDILDGNRMPLTSLTIHNSSRLIKNPQHKIAVIVDFYLNSEEFRLLLRTRLFGRGLGVDLDIALEKLNICGKLDIELSVDMDSPFPHVTEVSIMFLEKPEVWFSLRILKAVQMMEVPVLKSWIHSIVMDALETSLVDPGKIEFKLSGHKDTYPDLQKGVSSAQGVLTITLNASQPGIETGDLKWIILRLGDQNYKTSPVTQSWSEAASFLVESLQTDKLIIKLKNKRLVSTVTLAQYEMNLFDYNLDYSRTVETLLQKKSKMTNIPNISVRLEYTPLVFDMIDQPTPRLFGSSCIVCGVLTVLIHGAHGLTFSESGPSYSCCVIYIDRKKVKTTHCIADSTDPQWESRFQFLVNDYTKTSLSFVVCCSWNKRKITNDEMIGLAVLTLSENETCITNKEIPLNGSTNSSSITVSVTFQPVNEMSTKEENHSPHQYNDLDFKEDSIRSKNHSQSWMKQAKNIIVRNDQEFQSGENIGNILTSGQGLLEFNLLRARDLMSMDKNGFSDPYYELQINGECKYKSSVKKKTLNPCWDENGIVPLPIPGSTLDLILWDHDTFGKNDFLGRIAFNIEEIREMSNLNYPTWHTLNGVRSGQVEVKIRIISDPLSRNRADSSATSHRAPTERSRIKLGVNIPPPAPPRNFSSQHKNTAETLVEQLHRNLMGDMPCVTDSISIENVDSEKKSQIDGSSATRTSSRTSSCRTSDFSINEYSPVATECTTISKPSDSELPPFQLMKQKVTKSLRLRKFKSESNVRMQNGNTLQVKEARDLCMSQSSLSQRTLQTNNSHNSKNTPIRPTELNLYPMARPDRYSGIEGKVVQAQGLHVAHVAQLYCSIKLIGAHTGGRSRRNNGGKTLAKSELYPAVPNPQFNLPFQIVSPESIARQAVLQFEIRSSGKENVALRRVTLQDLLSADGKETHTWLALNNGASLEVVIAHGRELKKSSRKLFRSWSVHKIGKI